MFKEIDKKAVISPQEIDVIRQNNDAAGQKIVFLDASFYLPDSGEKARDNFEKDHIAGALFYDITHIKDHCSPLPHMLPARAFFEQEMSNLGIENDDIIIIYGQTGIVMGPCRAWWMIRGFGHSNVFVLDGGLPHWKECGMSTTGEISAPRVKSNYTANNFNIDMIVDIDQVRDISDNRSHTILDARPAGRFSGEQAEPRESMRSGHIPNSINLPCSLIVDEYGCLTSKEHLHALFNERGIDIRQDAQYTTTCGSGVTACALSLALFSLGIENVSVYDGSWSEWGQKDSPTEVASGQS